MKKTVISIIKILSAIIIIPCVSILLVILLKQILIINQKSVIKPNFNGNTIYNAVNLTTIVYIGTKMNKPLIKVVKNSVYRNNFNLIIIPPITKNPLHENNRKKEIKNIQRIYKSIAVNNIVYNKIFIISSGYSSLFHLALLQSGDIYPYSNIMINPAWQNDNNISNNNFDYAVYKNYVRQLFWRALSSADKLINYFFSGLNSNSIYDKYASRNFVNRLRINEAGKKHNRNLITLIISNNKEEQYHSLGEFLLKNNNLQIELIDEKYKSKEQAITDLLNDITQQ